VPSGVDSPWPYVGRDTERRRIADTLDRPGALGVAVVGPAGVGKTELVRTAVSGLGGRACHWIVASPAARRIPFGAVAELLGRLPGEASDPAGYLIAAREVLAAHSAPGTSPGRPIVVIDDAPHLDHASVVLVTQLLRRGEVQVVLTVREGQPLADEIGRFLDDGSIDELVLAPLGPDAVHDVLQSVLEGPVDPVLSTEVHERTQGNALFIREVVTAGIAGGAVVWKLGEWRLDGPLPLSRRLMDVVARRVTAVTGETAAALQYVAVGQPLALDAAMRLCGADGLVALERDRLVVTRHEQGRPLVRMAHPLVAEAVLASLEPSQRARRVRALAEALGADGPGDADRSLRWAVERLDAGVPVPAATLSVAAAHAFSLLDHPLAERLAAAGIDAGDPFECRLVLGAARSAQLDLPGGEAALRVALRAATDDSQRARATGRLGLHLAIRAGRIDEALTVMRSGLDAVGDTDWRAFLTADLRKVETLAGVAPTAGAAGGDDVIVRANTCIAGALLAALAGDVRAAEGHVADGLALAPSVRSALPNIDDLLLLARYLARSFGGDGAGAEVLAAAQVDRARAGRSEPLGMWLAVLASTALLTGHPARAVDLAVEASPLLAERDFVGGFLQQTMAVEATARAQLGEVGAADALLRRIDPVWLGDAKTALQVAAAEAWITASTGRMAEAAERIAAAASTALAAGLVPLAALVAHDAVRLGQPQVVTDLLAEAAERAPDTVAVLLGQSAEAWLRDDPADLEAAAGGLILAGSSGVAAELLQRAGRGFRRRGRQTDAARVERAASAVAAPEGSLTFSPRELEIAALVAARWRSKEIAAHLAISRRTVDNTLARLYRKAEVTSREELTRRLVELGVLAPGEHPGDLP
jgi:DNA-binding CsgD family transcriptional regulator